MILYTDGASRGNPGKSGIGFVLKDKEIVLLKDCYEIDKTTNNFAEIIAIIIGFYTLKKNNYLSKEREIKVYSDSLLIVNQFNGEFKIESTTLMQAHVFFQRYFGEYDIDFVHIPRELNKEADALANHAIDNNKKLPKEIISFLSSLYQKI